MLTEWQYSTEFATPTRFKKFAANHRREYESCFSNLNKLLELLNAGHPVARLVNNPSFFRSEREGLYRIGQSGVKDAKESRLYIYPDEKSEMIYILDIGTKETQRTDIPAAKKVIKHIKRNSLQS
jgi:hypothetical protein